MCIGMRETLLNLEMSATRTHMHTQIGESCQTPCMMSPKVPITHVHTYIHMYLHTQEEAARMKMMEHNKQRDNAKIRDEMNREMQQMEVMLCACVCACACMAVWTHDDSRKPCSTNECDVPLPCGGVAQADRREGNHELNHEIIGSIPFCIHFGSSKRETRKNDFLISFAPNQAKLLELKKKKEDEDGRRRIKAADDRCACMSARIVCLQVCVCVCVCEKVGGYESCRRHACVHARPRVCMYVCMYVCALYEKAGRE